MNSIKIRLALLTLAVALIFSCRVPKLSNHTFYGVLSATMRIYDTATREFVMADHDRDALIYYRDSLIIVEQLIEREKITDNIRDTIFTEIEYYHFADLRTNTETKYKAFSDTANPISIFKIHPEIDLWSVWTYYGHNKSKNSDSSFSNQGDTIIGNKNYKRLLSYSTFENGTKKDTGFQLYYVDCNSTHSQFQYNIRTSRKFAEGCPIQMYELFWSNYPMRVRAKFEFIRDNLTLQEHKVFDAWEKYSKEHPVKD